MTGMGSLYVLQEKTDRLSVTVGRIYGSEVKEKENERMKIKY